MIIFFLSRDYLFTLINISKYFIFVIIISTCYNSSKTVLPVVSILLANKVKFVHKPDQVELQLDRSQLPYSEHSSLILQEVAQPTLTTKGPLQLEKRFFALKVMKHLSHFICPHHKENIQVRHIIYFKV